MCQTGECGCRHPAHHAPAMVGHQWGSCAQGYPPRRFPTKEESIAQLEQYLKDLRAEAKGVEERLAEFKKAG